MACIGGAGLLQEGQSKWRGSEWRGAALMLSSVDIRGGWKHAKPAGGRPLGGRSGGSFMDATFRAWRKVPPSGEHKARENAVPENEHPWRSDVVQQSPKPMLDESS